MDKKNQWKKAPFNVNKYRQVHALQSRYTGTTGDYFYELETVPVISKLQAFNGRILDLGCGTGRLLTKLQGPQKFYTGMDIELEMLKTCQIHDSAYTPSFVQGNMYELPFRDHSFQGIVALGAFHLSSELSPLFREMSRVLSKGGVAVLTCWNTPPFRMRNFYVGKDAAVHSPDNVVTMLQRNGFHHIDIDSTFHFPPNLYWYVYKRIYFSALQRIWSNFIIKLNKQFLSIPVLQKKGGELIVRAYRN